MDTLVRINRWRGPERGHYTGCSAGHNAIGIEADGTIKGCPSLPTERYRAGNVRQASLKQLWTRKPSWHSTAIAAYRSCGDFVVDATTLAFAEADARGWRMRYLDGLVTIPTATIVH